MFDSKNSENFEGNVGFGYKWAHWGKGKGLAHLKVLHSYFSFS